MRLRAFLRSLASVLVWCAASAGAEPIPYDLRPPDPLQLLAKAFSNGRRLAAAERLLQVSALAADPARAVKLDQGDKGNPLLPPEEALPGAAWVALVNAQGERVAVRGQAPLDLPARPITRRALSAFLRDDLLDSESGPLYVAASPVAREGRVVGALLVGWPEFAWSQGLADDSCACKVGLFVNQEQVAGARGLVAPEAPFWAVGPAPLSPFQLPNAPRIQAVRIPVEGELRGVSYFLFFETSALAAMPAPVVSSGAGADPLVLGAFLFGTALLSGALLFFARALSRRSVLAREDKIGARLPSLFDEFAAAKVRCGEDVTGLHQERFSAKVREVFGQFAERAGTDALSLRVVVKNGRAQVVIAPEGEV
jgi:hypothetical protein